ncbi:MAG TPA: hypothetical protein PKH73_00770, partial [Candidatus Pacearchaeota archaeon]|nr:hypothetical protein [Candidatus Pacearchaeota archaeon]HQD88994.1 hypothetical protein [Candidatus Pacearchaeota archaeon]
MALFKKNKKDIKSSKGYLDKVRAEQKKRSEDELHLLEIRTMAKDLARFSIPEEKLSQLQKQKQKQEQKEKEKALLALKKKREEELKKQAIEEKKMAALELQRKAEREKAER